MPTSCAAYKCGVKHKKGMDVKFHRFPKNEIIRNKWVTALGRKDYVPSATAVICSNHFKPEDYFVNPYGTKVLRKEAIPSVFDRILNRNDTEMKSSHQCKCGSVVEENGIHGLSCKFSSGRFSRHHAVNDLIKRAMSTAEVPSILEPVGISRDDGKRPDGMSLIPWKCGKSLVWDFTCVDTVATSHLMSTSTMKGAAAVSAEKNKIRKYSGLGNFYCFYPVAIETYGVFGPHAAELLKEIGKRMMISTEEPRSYSFLIQRISLAIQRGNAASVMGTLPSSRKLDEIFLYPQKHGLHGFENNTFETKIKNSFYLESPVDSIRIPVPTNIFDIVPALPAPSTSGKTPTFFGLNGLKNIGNTCFLNSVIHCLSNTRCLLEYLNRDAYKRDINTNASREGALIKAFAEVIKELWSEDSSGRVVDTVALKSQIEKFAPRFTGYDQEDAQEFLLFLLEGLHEDVNRATEKPNSIMREIDEKSSDSEKAQESWSIYSRTDNSKIVDYFVGQLKSTLKCTYCGHCSVSFDPFWDLSLPIPRMTGQLSLSQCLDLFKMEETLDGDEKPTCAKCKERRKCSKSLLIHKFPKILVIHLKRFSSTESFRGKLNVTIDFPLEGLDMSNYADENVAPCRYSLFALSNHSGSTYSGHYTAYCRHPYVSTWHEYNDSHVTPIPSRSIVSGEAYILFYEQEDTKSHPSDQIRI